MTETLDSMTRAELLELCKKRGLKATAWKKERMADELRKLDGAAPEKEPPDNAEAPAAGDGAGQGGRETTAAENPDAPPRLSGWCSLTPMWSRQHLACKVGSPGCACPCHAPGWARPPAPEGARLSKFNPERHGGPESAL